MTEITYFKSYEKNTLRGFFNVRLTDWSLEIRGCTLHEKNGNEWICLPSRTYEKNNGEMERVYHVEFYDNTRFLQFQKSVLNALRGYRSRANIFAGE